MKWKVPQLWKDGECVIIGGGPSVLHQLGASSPDKKYFEVLKKYHVIGVNHTYKLGADICDAVFFGDNGFWKDNIRGLMQYKGLRVTCAPIPCTGRVKELYRDNVLFGISDDPTKIRWNNNSGGAAINFAYHTGVKRIILLGFDLLSEGPNRHHWHNEYGERSLQRQEKAYKKHFAGFQVIADDLKGAKIEVINCNPDSAIQAFPKANFKDL